MSGSEIVLDEGMVSRAVRVRTRDVVFLKGVVEAYEGVAQVYAERGGELTLAAPKSREAELFELVRVFDEELHLLV